MPASLDLEKLYDAHAPALHGFLLNLTRNEAEAKDVLQSLFCKLAAKPRILDRVGNANALLHRMAYNLFIDTKRRDPTAEAPAAP